MFAPATTLADCGNAPMTDAPKIVPDQKPKRRAHRSPHGIGVFVTDLELVEYLGVPEQTAAQAIASAEQHNGFPRKQAMWGNRRFLPAVEAWLNEVYGFKMRLQPQPRERVHVSSR